MPGLAPGISFSARHYRMLRAKARAWQTQLYVRPVGLLYGATAEAAVADGLALPLAGGPIAFTAAELIEGEPGNTKMRLFAAPALASPGDADLAALLARITAKRPPFAGLALDRPVLMGIVNVTPDSFSDGGLYDTKEGGDRSCRRARRAPARRSSMSAASRPGRGRTPWRRRRSSAASCR